MEANKLNILIVDDEKDVVEVLKGSLSRKGYEVDGALSGEEALEILKKQETDLILLDIVMPGLKGTEVAKIVKEKYPHTKIMVVTAFPKESEALTQENITEGLFIKPFKLKELYTKLEEIMRPQETADTQHQEEIKTRVIFIKAGLLFVEPSHEIYQFLRQQFQQLASRGQHYDIDVANDETALFRKLAISEPDIVIFEESYLHSLDVRVPSRILLFSQKTKEIISFNLSSTLSDFNEMEKLIEKIRTLCIQNGLLEIR